jgi:hypothetical protein
MEAKINTKSLCTENATLCPTEARKQLPGGMKHDDSWHVPWMIDEGGKGNGGQWKEKMP